MGTTLSPDPDHDRGGVDVALEAQRRLPGLPVVRLPEDEGGARATGGVARAFIHFAHACMHS